MIKRKLTKCSPDCPSRPAAVRPPMSELTIRDVLSPAAMHKADNAGMVGGVHVGLPMYVTPAYEMRRNM
jgi:hypothetical protein